MNIETIIGTPAPTTYQLYNDSNQLISTVIQYDQAYIVKAVLLIVGTFMFFKILLAFVRLFGGVIHD